MGNEENNALNTDKEGKKSGGMSAKNPLKNVKGKADQVQKMGQTGQKLLNNHANKLKEKAGKKTGEASAKLAAKAAKSAKYAEKMGKVASQAAKVGKMAAKLGKIIASVGWIILLIIAIIGLIVFILTGLGLIMSGLLEIAQAFGDALVGLISGKENIIHDDEILDTLTYLEEMDYDLYGYGFSTVPDPITEEEGTNGEKIKKLTYPAEEIHWLDTTWDRMADIVAHNKAYKYIRAYLISDNYSNIVQHQNRTLSDLFTDAPGNGLIAIYHEEGELGKKGDPYKKLDTGSITLEDGKLSITDLDWKIWDRFVLEYDIDGWTGRYGMPLEFLLAVHLSTMAPEVSYKMATKFPTEVQVLLHKVEGEVNAAVQHEKGTGQVSYEDFKDIQGQWLLDSWYMSDSEALQIFNDYNGKIESYIGDDVPEWKCTGPATYGEDLIRKNSQKGTWNESEGYRSWNGR